MSVLFCYPFCPFDDAKVRRFLELTMAFLELCAQTVLFVD